MTALTLAAEIALDLRDRERRFARGYTDHGLTRSQIAAYYRRRAAEWRRRAVEGYPAAPTTEFACLRSARLCDRRAKECER